MLWLRKILFREFFDFIRDNEFNKVLEIGASSVYNARNYGVKAKKIILTDVQEGKDLVFADARDLPFKHREFDLVICVAVLEHIFDFQKAIHEMKRVSGKYLFVGVPFVYKRHNDEDYWRFTEEALDKLVGWKKEFSFRTLSISPDLYLSHCALYKRG